MYTSVRPDVGSLGGPSVAARGRVPATVVLLGLTSLFTDASAEMVTAVLPLYLTLELGLTPLAFGFVDGIYQGVSTTVRIVAGYVADRTRRPKRVAVAGYGLSMLCKPGLLLAGSSLAAIGAVIAIDRTGKGIRTAPRDALIAATSQPALLGRSFGVHRSLDTVGALAGPLLAFALLAAVPGSYDSVFVVSTALALIGLAVLVLLVPDLTPEGLPAAGPTVRTARLKSAPMARSGISSPAPPRLRDAVGLLADLPYRRAVLATFGLGLLTLSDGFVYLALQRSTDLATRWFPLLFVGTAAVYLALAVPLGRLADRVGRVPVFLSGHVALLAVYGLLLGGRSGGWLVLVCLSLLGLYYACTDGVIAAHVAGLVPGALRTSGLAGVQTASAAGRLVAALLFGGLWTGFGRDVGLMVFVGGLALAIPLGALLLRNRVSRD